MGSETLRGLERGLAVLNVLEQHDGISLRDLHGQTGLPKPTLLRILATLEAQGFARRRIGDGGWRRCALRQRPASQVVSVLLDVGGALLDDLCRRVVWPSDLAVYDDGAMQILETSRRLSPFVMTHAGIGLRVPILQSGLGLAYLAFCPDEEREAIVAQLIASTDPFNRPARDRCLVAALVQETRTKGYAVRTKGFQPRRVSEDKTCGIALPILAGGRVVATINLVWILSAFDERTFVERYLDTLRETALEFSQLVDSSLKASGAGAA